LQAQEPEQESPLVPFTNGINFGFRDSITNKVRIMPVYNGVSFFYGRFAKVKVNNKWGVINKKGETILETKFDSLFILKNNIFLCYQNSKTLLVNYLGKSIGEYDNILIFEDNDSRLVARDMVESTHSFFGNSVLYIVNNGGQYMKVVKTDTTLVKYSDGMSSKYIREKRTFPYVQGGKFGLLNDKCEPLSGIKADSVKIFMKVYNGF